jgi:hypothetical protein
MAMSKGCTITLIVLAVIVVIIIVGLVILWMNKDKLLEAGISYMTEAAETEIVKNLPDGYTPESVHDIMEELKAGIKDGRIEGLKAQELANTFQAAMADKEIDKEEGANLLGVIQDALGMQPVETEEMPVDSLPDSLQAIPDSA